MQQFTIIKIKLQIRFIQYVLQRRQMEVIVYIMQAKQIIMEIM